MAISPATAGSSRSCSCPHLLGYVESINATRAHLEGRFDDMARSARAQLALREGPTVPARACLSGAMRLLELDIGRIGDRLVGTSPPMPGVCRVGLRHRALARIRAYMDVFTACLGTETGEACQYPPNRY